LKPVITLCFQISPRIFFKIEMAPMCTRGPGRN
jgi:hypothetical protein